MKPIVLKGTGSISADREIINYNFDLLFGGVISTTEVLTSGSVATTSNNVNNQSLVNGESITTALNNLLASIGDTNLLTIVDEYGDLPTTPTEGDIAYVRNISGSLTKIVSALYVYDGVWELITRKDGVIYITELDDTIVSPGIEIPAGTTVQDLKGITFSQFVDNFVFPTVFPSIQVSNSGVVSFTPTTSLVEVGTLMDITLNATFNRGSIQNGDGSVGPDLVGLPSSYIFTGAGIPTNVTILSTALTESIDSTDTGFNAFNAIFGSQNWNVEINYSEGTGTYYDSKANSSTLLDSSRVANSITDLSSSIVGRYYAFHDIGYIPVDSIGVRSTSDRTFLSASGTGSFNITIPANTPEVFFSAPVGKTITVNYVESSNADVSGTFIKNTFDVNDANGSPVSYDTWSSIIGGGGYPVDATYSVVIS